MDRLSAADLTELSGICPGGVRRDVDLVVQPEDTEQVPKLLSWFGTRGIKPVVIGLTSNLLFDDAGLRAPCVQIGQRMGQLSIDGTDVQAGAGLWVPGLARKLVQAGLGGAEHICGIPGTLGGLSA